MYVKDYRLRIKGEIDLIFPTKKEMQHPHTQNKEKKSFAQFVGNMIYFRKVIMSAADDKFHKINK